MTKNTTYRIVLTKPVAHLDMTSRELRQTDNFIIVPYQGGRRQRVSTMPLDHQMTFLAVVTPDQKYRWFMEYEHGSRREISQVLCPDVQNIRE